MSKKIKVAIAGIGNCAQAFISGIEYYKKNPKDTRGLMHQLICDYAVTDIEVVAAFDINAYKVGKDLSEAIFAAPNCAYKYPKIKMEKTGVIVKKGPTFDGNPPYLNAFYELSNEPDCDVVQVLKNSKAEMLLNFIPTESHEAAKYYADSAICNAKIGFINGMPTLIVCDPEYQKKAIENKVPLIGDDVKSQFGGTIIHRALVTVMKERGIHLSRTYQLNFAGNTDFENLLHRGKSKHRTKQEAVTSLMPYPIEMSTGFTFIELMKDRKTSMFYIDGANFGNAPLHLEAKLEVEDSANFAGVMVDMVRLMRVALDRKISGALSSACSFLTKHPPTQIPDSQAAEAVDDFIAGKRNN